MKYLAVILALIIGTPSIADAKFSKADKAIQCSALYLIATSITAGNKQNAKALINLQRMFDRVYSVNRGHVLKRPINKGMVSDRKSEMQMELAKKYDSDPQSIYSLQIQCGSWAQDLTRHLKDFIGKSSDVGVIKNAYLSVSGIPVTPVTFLIPQLRNTNAKWLESKNFMDKSFTAWSKTGRMTRKKFKQQLKDSLDKKSAKKQTIKPWEMYQSTKKKPAKTKLDFSDFRTMEQMKIIKDKISKCMFKNVKKVTNALQYSIIQKECKRQAVASTK